MWKEYYKIKTEIKRTEELRLIIVNISLSSFANYTQTFNC